MTFAFAFPAIDPVFLELGPVSIKWYGIAYVAGLLLAWRYVAVLAKSPPRPATPAQLDDFLMWAMVGVVVGGRMGYVLFYQFDGFMANPARILAVWEGGMSFHGGFIGVMVAEILFVRRRAIPFLPFVDLIACAVPIGLFLGRLANFVNGELFGRVTDAPWGVIFPRGGPYPRHPSQLYEAGLEGVVLFIVLYLVWRRESLRLRAGLLTGVFMTGYALSRMTAEMFREPDSFLGFFVAGSTMGQWLSVPMLLVGLILIVRAKPLSSQTPSQGSASA